MTDKQIATLKQLLDTNFSESDLRCLCYDVEVFWPVYHRLKPETSKRQIIGHLIDQAQSTAQLDLLNTLAVNQSLTELTANLTKPQTLQSVLEAGSLDATEVNLLRALVQAPKPASRINRMGARSVVGSRAGGNIITGNNNQLGGVRIGKVGGSISGQIAGRDINQGTQPEEPDSPAPLPPPSADQLSQTLGLAPANLPTLLASLGHKLAPFVGDRGVAGSSAAGDIVTGDGNQLGGVSIDEVDGDITGQIAARDITGRGPQPQAAQPVTLEQLRQQTEDILTHLPADKQAEAEMVSVFLAELFDEVAKPDPRPAMLTLRGQSLIQAAQALSEGDSKVLRLVEEVVDRISMK